MEITVFDTNGKRHILRGKEGDTLVDLLAMNEDVLGGTGDGAPPPPTCITIPFLFTLLVEHAHQGRSCAGAGVVGLSPDGRGVMEAIVTIPNAYLAQVRNVLNSAVKCCGSSSRLHNL